MTISLDMTPDNGYPSENIAAHAAEGVEMNEKNLEAKDLVERLRKLVNYKSLVHRRVAEKLGVSHATFSRWMNEHTSPTSEANLKSISRFIKQNS